MLQVLAQSSSVALQSSSQAVSSSSTLSTNSSPSGEKLANPTIDQCISRQIKLDATIEELEVSISQAQKTFEQQMTNTEFQNSQVTAMFNELIGQCKNQLERAKKFEKGSALFLADLRRAGSSVKDEWFEAVSQLQHYAWFSLVALTEGIQDVKIFTSQISQNKQVYDDAKERQMAHTTEQMEENQKQLEEKVEKVGLEGLAAFNQVLNEWAMFLRTKLGSKTAELEITQMYEIATPALTDMQKMRPEDMEHTLDDAHKAIDEIKELFYSLGIETDVVRRLTNDFQVRFFKIFINVRNFKTNLVFNSIATPKYLTTLLQELAISVQQITAPNENKQSYSYSYTSG